MNPGHTDSIAPDTIPLALYVHIPWCVRKCPYCDFNSHETQQIPETDYLHALLNDLRQDQSLAQGREISSLFFGGGTPSLMSVDFYQRLLEAVHRIVPIARDAEISLEANPGTFEYAKFRGFYQAGINRLSIGVQSFNPQHLQSLGRIHSAEQAATAIKAAQDVGFQQINIDLMHGLPQQHQPQALDDLQQALALQPNHLSWYQLTIEPNTLFYSKPPKLPDEDLLQDMESAGFQLLTTMGYQQYETSAFAKPAGQCQHNLNYWLFGDYLAIGAGAHGKISEPETQRIIRYQKTRLPRDYLNPEKAFTAQHNQIAENELPFEFFMNAFRLQQPIAKTWFQERTFLNAETVKSRVDRAAAQGLVVDTGEHWQTTPLGQRFLNSLLEYFTPD